jgi:hypothetical protein
MNHPWLKLSYNGVGVDCSVVGRCNQKLHNTIVTTTNHAKGWPVGSWGNLAMITKKNVQASIAREH